MTRPIKCDARAIFEIDDVEYIITTTQLYPGSPGDRESPPDGAEVTVPSIVAMLRYPRNVEAIEDFVTYDTLVRELTIERRRSGRYGYVEDDAEDEIYDRLLAAALDWLSEHDEPDPESDECQHDRFDHYIEDDF